MKTTNPNKIQKPDCIKFFPCIVRVELWFNSISPEMNCNIIFPYKALICLDVEINPITSGVFKMSSFHIDNVFDTISFI